MPVESGLAERCSGKAPPLWSARRVGHKCSAGFLRAVGASPSGKAADFDSAIRRFESSRPSQAVQSPLLSRVMPNLRPLLAAFCGRVSLCKCVKQTSHFPNCPKVSTQLLKNSRFVEIAGKDFARIE